MQRFARLTGRSGELVYVNPGLVRIVTQDSSSGETRIIFDLEHSTRVRESADEAIRRLQAAAVPVAREVAAAVAKSPLA